VNRVLSHKKAQEAQRFICVLLVLFCGCILVMAQAQRRWTLLPESEAEHVKQLCSRSNHTASYITHPFFQLKESALSIGIISIVKDLLPGRLLIRNWYDHSNLQNVMLSQALIVIV
jgi:hypothetical protein